MVDYRLKTENVRNYLASPATMWTYFGHCLVRYNFLFLLGLHIMFQKLHEIPNWINMLHTFSEDSMYRRTFPKTSIPSSFPSLLCLHALHLFTFNLTFLTFSLHSPSLLVSLTSCKLISIKKFSRIKHLT